MKNTNRQKNGIHFSKINIISFHDKKKTFIVEKYLYHIIKLKIGKIQLN